MERSTFFTLIVSATIMTVLSLAANNYIPMNFTTNLYPATPMKNVQSLAMKLWGYVDGACGQQAMKDHFLSNQARFAQQLLSLHSMVDILLLSLEEQAHECPDCVVRAMSDCEYLFDAIITTANRYAFLVPEVKTQSAVVIDYLFKAILTKLEHVIETGQLAAPLHVFFVPDKVYSSETTPLLPPAKMAPVAPIA